MLLLMLGCVAYSNKFYFVKVPAHPSCGGTGHPGNVNIICIVSLDPAYPAIGGTRHLPVNLLSLVSNLLHKSLPH